MRAAIPGIPSRYPLGTMLPSLYATDDLAQRFTAGLDTVLAPVLSVLDNFTSYLDTALAPEDFLDWLGYWVAASVDPDAPEGRRREVVARALELHRWRGTRRGLAELLRLQFGVEAEIEESGGAVWSATARMQPPGSGEAWLVVRVRLADHDPVLVEHIETAVAGSCPIHVRYRVEVVSASQGGANG